ncbi:predicted protein [Pyrenophora tritici-repentis Pt-1C-BFP]|uniref:Uncharacterized protein n=1 Tax=Pyrenophora tritici-repentis (strain Pt-1C-BFP) TaxID=426418 RepID=B2WCF8_PYRTR|nr:uncharacterized protein PTRG_07667 [Pyrenophora tritici-repentis Pt-1C-BFP]EDU50586.1 predicted protein [Pyrenophora tritici-repentis Pt-1C-BFP]
MPPPHDRPYPHQLRNRSPFDETPSFHDCPTPIAQLIEPAIQYLGIGPGLCTRDNLFGLGYLVLLAINYGLLLYVICVVLIVFTRLCGWYGGDMLTVRRFEGPKATARVVRQASAPT